MTKLLMCGLFAFTAVAHAYTYPFTLNCKVTSTKTEVDDESLKDEGYEYLREILSGKTAQMSVDGEYVVMNLLNVEGKAIEFITSKYDSTTGKIKITKSDSVTLKQYVSKGYTKRGEVAFYNDDVAPMDDSYGAHFDLVFKKADIERGSGKMDVRIWTAGNGEPTDVSDGGLVDSSNVFMSCQTR